MPKIYNPTTKEFENAEYDPITNRYYDSEGRSLGTAGDEYTHGTAVKRRGLNYDPITHKYYRMDEDGIERAVADGPDDD
ncbi:hypothetical protein HZC30_07780 [Candidatus Woesearchaeota archaeon]|nr:hypothetical protein [Candidatus Woesearchaeota archaeon]